MNGENERADMMATRILAVLAVSDRKGVGATIGEVLDIVARDSVRDERELALLTLGSLTARNIVAYVDEYRRDVPLRDIRLRLIPFDGPWSRGG